VIGPLRQLQFGHSRTGAWSHPTGEPEPPPSRELGSASGARSLGRAEPGRSRRSGLGTRIGSRASPAERLRCVKSEPDALVIGLWTPAGGAGAPLRVRALAHLEVEARAVAWSRTWMLSQAERQTRFQSSNRVGAQRAIASSQPNRVRHDYALGVPSSARETRFRTTQGAGLSLARRIGGAHRLCAQARARWPSSLEGGRTSSRGASARRCSSGQPTGACWLGCW
jgi:hypothetical protein